MLRADKYEARILIGRRDVRTDGPEACTHVQRRGCRAFRERCNGAGVASGDYGQVIARDAEANLVKLRVGSSSREVTYDPRRAFGVEIFTAEKRWVAEGERVQLTRPWKDGKRTRVANREIGTIERLDALGNAKVKLDGGRTVEWNLATMLHLDYAYAITSYSLQSKTGERTLLHIDTGGSRIQTLIDKPLVYVGASRGNRELVVFTDDKQCLLGEHSPVNRMTLKPKALAREEIEERRFGGGVRVA